MIKWSNDLAVSLLLSVWIISVKKNPIGKHDHKELETMIIKLKKAWSQNLRTMIIKSL